MSMQIGLSIKQNWAYYSSYKESGVEWLAKVPAQWVISRLKNYVQSPNVKNNFENRRFIDLEHIEPSSGKLVDGYEPEVKVDTDSIKFETDDVLFGKLRPYLRKFWLASYSGSCSSELLVLRPNHEIYKSKYLFYLIQSEYFI